MTQFQFPEFLENSSTSEIHAKMKEILPSNLDVSEGSHAWNFTRPTALVVAEICQFILPEVIKNIFPEWSYGQFLDAHAKTRGMERRSAVQATGTITVKGNVNTLIPKGSLFSTASVNESPSIDYETTENAEIQESGEVLIPIQCVDAGTIGNANKDTIIICSSKITGITGVTNEDEITGGTDEESDDSLRERIIEYDKTQGDNFVGSVSDYKRWSESVDGVGKATVIPAQDDTGTVRIILTDSNGDPATEVLREQVYHFIMRPDSPLERLAPVNALLSVEAPTTIEVSIKATIKFVDGYTIDSVKKSFSDNLAMYLPDAMEEEEIKYTRIASVLSGTEGVDDFYDLLIAKKGESFSASNIPITESELARVEQDDLILTSHKA